MPVRNCPLKGEAYFIRAYMYSQLMFGHGGVVINKQPFGLQDDFSTIVRSSIEETKDAILEDIDEAITLLAGKTTDQGRATAAAAAALRSRVLLSGKPPMVVMLPRLQIFVSFPAG
jgi:hypothetical protein